VSGLSATAAAANKTQLSSFTQHHSRAQSSHILGSPPATQSSPSNRQSTAAHQNNNNNNNNHHHPPQSSSFTSILAPILTQLSHKYRNVSESGQIITVDPNLEHTIDEIKAAFYSLELQHPGACDLFIKNIFNVLNSTTTASTSASLSTSHS
jgi:hypothetical protein